MKRYIENAVMQDLKRKMVFIGGPRQVGKTTLSKQICVDAYPKSEYLNWDLAEDRQIILTKAWQPLSELVVFDEIHKYPKWKQWIKGVFDTKSPNQEYLITGSARLDVYHKGGDSLMGRYHYWRLHPLTLDELPSNLTPEESLQRLLTLGGFPEPFFVNDEREARRWRRERFDRILREDVRDLKEVHNIQMLQLFVDSLRHRAGQLITVANLARDLEISPKTAKSWLTLCEYMYIAFPVYPLTTQVPRSIQKPPKVYFYDNADLLTNHGLRLENLVATTLLKRLQFIEDFHGYRCKLHYIRDKEGREVDFVTVKDGQIEELIEVKLNDSEISSSLVYYANKLKPKRVVQIVGGLKKPFNHQGILVIDPLRYFTEFCTWDEFVK